MCIAKVGSDVVSQAESFSLVQCLVVENSRLVMVKINSDDDGDDDGDDNDDNNGDAVKSSQTCSRHLCEVVFVS